MLPPALATDLAILRLTGADIDDRGDHLIVRSPANPTHHWGNFIVVKRPGAVDDAEHWLTVFAENFPAAGWVAIGLPAMPEDRAAWVTVGLELEALDALATRTLPRPTSPVAGYEVRQLSGTDWDLQLTRAIAENAAAERHPAPEFAQFAENRSRQRRALCSQGAAAWFGAFRDGALVADLGIVACGATARYQDVSTDAEHRRRGLAGHLLGVAAQWAADRRCTEWVIVTEATNEAGRLYRAAGFDPALGSVEAYRSPAARPTT